MSHDPTWPRVRAALLALVIGVHLVWAAPLPPTISDAELKTPTAQEELRRWSQRLASLGVSVSPEQLGERVQAVAGVIGRSHRAVMRPFRPVGALTGTSQGWPLFANPNLRPPRFEVRVRRRGGEFERRYAQLDPEHDWWRARLRYRRVRGNWSTFTGVRQSQRRFARWLARRVFDEEPDVVAVQTRMLRTRTPLPGRAHDGHARGEPRQVITIEREELGL